MSKSVFFFWQAPTGLIHLSIAERNATFCGRGHENLTMSRERPTDGRLCRRCEKQAGNEWVIEWLEKYGTAENVEAWRREFAGNGE